MKMIIEVPDKYLDVVAGILASCYDDMDHLNSLKEACRGATIEVETGMIAELPENKEKQVCVGLAALAIMQKVKEEMRNEEGTQATSW